jgi:U2 small nuclear ribonucleoprotein A'
MEAGKPAAPAGPRLLGRLTAELVMRSPQYMNAIDEYEIDLRGALVSVCCV